MSCGDVSRHYFYLHKAVSVRVSDGGKRADCLSQFNGKTVYGTVRIVEHPHAVYRWSFCEIVRVGWMYIGIDSSESEHIAVDYTECDNKHPFYSWGPLNKYSHRGSEYSQCGTVDWNELDELVMALDTKKKTLTFYADHQSDGNHGIVAFTEIDFDGNTVYRLAILVGAENETITLKHFEKKQYDSAFQS